MRRKRKAADAAVPTSRQGSSDRPSLGNAARIDRIRALLEQAFSPLELEIIDESHLHAGHAGAREGKGHFRVRIVAESFRGRRSLERHRMVFAALGTMMSTDIHALSVTASGPAP
jgi:BolA protein